MSRKPTVCLDFDGTLHSYTAWIAPHVVNGPPTPGAREAVQELVLAGYRIVICSARASSPSGKSAIQAWCVMHAIPVDDITSEKPTAVCYVDDRGIRFEGNWAHVLMEIRRLYPPA